MKLLKSLLGICNHQFEILERETLKEVSTSSKVGYLIVSRCKHCGKIKADKILAN